MVQQTAQTNLEKPKRLPRQLEFKNIELIVFYKLLTHFNFLSLFVNRLC